MVVPVLTTAPFLDAHHYLGATGRGIAWSDEYGVLVLAKPTSRRLPQDGTWLELSRWCLVGIKNGGSQQFAKVVRMIRAQYPEVTTLVSYSDPSVGHTGALYKACNWLWAPTWHRLRPPPTGNGCWRADAVQSPKDRWVFPLARDDRRAELLRVNDESLTRRDPTIGYREPRRFTRGRSSMAERGASSVRGAGSTPAARFKIAAGPQAGETS